jgi:hypothetical protein
VYENKGLKKMARECLTISLKTNKLNIASNNVGKKKGSYFQMLGVGYQVLGELKTWQRTASALPDMGRFALKIRGRSVTLCGI